MKKCTVGKLREQTALSPADIRVALVMRNPETGEMEATGFRVVDCYPDTTNERGEWKAVFKIEVESLPDAG